MAGVEWPGQGVRPTRRCLLDDLAQGLPTLDVRLEDVMHPIVYKAQRTPELERAGQGERVVSIDDRVWTKVKNQDWRGAAVNLEVAAPETAEQEASWWLGAAGKRRQDSPHEDFYAVFERSCIAYKRKHQDPARGCETCSDGFLPEEWDYKRLVAEQAYRRNDIIKAQVRYLARESLNNGHVIGRNFDGWQLEVCIRGDGPGDAEAYIVITGAGLTDPMLFALILSSIPGLTSDDWMPEPSSILGMTPASGEITWSAMLTPEVQATLLSDDE